MIIRTGDRIRISGMVVEILAEESVESWRCRNVTTQEEIVMRKEVIDRAVRLGKAEPVARRDAP